MNRDLAIENLLADLPPDDEAVADGAAALPAQEPRRDLSKMMRKIPVTLTLEVGSARLSLQDLMAIHHDSIVELDTLAGEPLTLKVNGTVIGRAEVVLAGENYGLKIVELDGLDLGSLTA